MSIPPPTPPSSSDPIRTFRESIDYLELMYPAEYSELWLGHSALPPRMIQLEKKMAFLVDYIDYLEGRVAALEASPTA